MLFGLRWTHVALTSNQSRCPSGLGAKSPFLVYENDIVKNCLSLHDFLQMTLFWLQQHLEYLILKYSLLMNNQYRYVLIKLAAFLQESNPGIHLIAVRKHNSLIYRGYLLLFFEWIWNIYLIEK